jgi:uncharacterized protein (DUF302 family)
LVISYGLQTLFFGSATMTYYFGKVLAVDFDEALRRTVEALKERSFGVITEIDVSETFRKKLGIAFRKYRILGACNPAMALEALQLEDKIGTMLPCNVVVQALEDGTVEIAAIDPVASMQAVDNPALKAAAAHVRAELKAVIDSL